MNREFGLKRCVMSLGEIRLICVLIYCLAILVLKSIVSKNGALDPWPGFGLLAWQPPEDLAL